MRHRVEYDMVCCDFSRGGMAICVRFVDIHVHVFGGSMHEIKGTYRYVHRHVH